MLAAWYTLSPRPISLPGCSAEFGTPAALSGLAESARPAAFDIKRESNKSTQ